MKDAYWSFPTLLTLTRSNGMAGITHGFAVTTSFLRMVVVGLVMVVDVVVGGVSKPVDVV